MLLKTGKSLDYLIRNIIFVIEMKNLIPRYTFYKNKYGSELLIDVVELKYVKKFLAQSSVHTLTYYDITFVNDMPSICILLTFAPNLTDLVSLPLTMGRT